jgi:hypothetical protein
MRINAQRHCQDCPVTMYENVLIRLLIQECIYAGMRLTYRRHGMVVLDNASRGAWSSDNDRVYKQPTDV